jgi:hypothetical protein
VHDRALAFLLEEFHDDRRDGFGPGDQEQMAVVDDVAGRWESARPAGAC